MNKPLGQRRRRYQARIIKERLYGNMMPDAILPSALGPVLRRLRPYQIKQAEHNAKPSPLKRR